MIQINIIFINYVKERHCIKKKKMKHGTLYNGFSVFNKIQIFIIVLKIYFIDIFLRD